MASVFQFRAKVDNAHASDLGIAALRQASRVGLSMLETAAPGETNRPPSAITDDYSGKAYVCWPSIPGFVLFHIWNTGIQPNCSSRSTRRHAAANTDTEAHTD